MFSKRMLSCVVVLVMVIELVGCGRPITNRDVGAATGGILGGLVGTQIGGGSGKTAAIIGGTVLGSMIGSQVGHEMDVENQQQLSHALGTLRLKHSHSWVDYHSGYRYTVTPIRTFHRGKKLCRRYKASVMIHDRLEHAVGRACRDADGVWHIVD